MGRMCKLLVVALLPVKVGLPFPLNYSLSLRMSNSKLILNVWRHILQTKVQLIIATLSFASSPVETNFVFISDVVCVCHITEFTWKRTFQIVFDSSWLLSICRSWHSFRDIICFHRQSKGCPFFFLFPSFSNQSSSISSFPPCGRLFFFGGTADAVLKATSTHLTYTKAIFLPPFIHTQLNSDAACKWLLNSCPPPSTSLHSSKYKLEICAWEKGRRKWKEMDWKHALSCCCCWDSFEMSWPTSSYIWHYFPDATALRVTVTCWSDVHATQ